MTVHAVIYTVPNCQKCKMTERILREVMRVKMEHLFDGNDTWSEAKIESFVSKVTDPFLLSASTVTRQVSDWMTGVIYRWPRLLTGRNKRRMNNNGCNSKR